MYQGLSKSRSSNQWMNIKMLRKLKPVADFTRLLTFSCYFLYTRD